MTEPIARGTVVWASLPDPLGSAPGYRRPVVVVQADAFNRSAIRTVRVVSLTTRLRLADAPGNVLVPAHESGLPRDSVANVSQLSSVDRAFLDEVVGSLPPRRMARIGDGLRLILSL